jgi:hypothetical protein
VDGLSPATAAAVALLRAPGGPETPTARTLTATAASPAIGKQKSNPQKKPQRAPSPLLGNRSIAKVRGDAARKASPRPPSLGRDEVIAGGSDATTPRPPLADINLSTNALYAVQKRPHGATSKMAPTIKVKPPISTVSESSGALSTHTAQQLLETSTRPTRETQFPEGRQPKDFLQIFMGETAFNVSVQAAAVHDRLKERRKRDCRLYDLRSLRPTRRLAGIDQLLAVHGLRRAAIKSDGLCLFRAISIRSHNGLVSDKETRGVVDNMLGCLEMTQQSRAVEQLKLIAGTGTDCDRHDIADGYLTGLTAAVDEFERWLRHTAPGTAEWLRGRSANAPEERIENVCATFNEWRASRHFAFEGTAAMVDLYATYVEQDTRFIVLRDSGTWSTHESQDGKPKAHVVVLVLSDGHYEVAVPKEAALAYSAQAVEALETETNHVIALDEDAGLEYVDRHDPADPMVISPPDQTREASGGAVRHVKRC